MELNTISEKDLVVFKVIKRCMKEERNLYSHCKRAFGNDGFKGLINRCYFSRKNHPEEPFDVNISFWPDDCNNLFSSRLTRLLYFSLLICFLDVKKDFLIKKFRQIYDAIIEEVHINRKIKKEDVFLIESYDQFFIKTFMVCYGNDEEASKIKYNCLNNIIKGLYMDIPF